MWISRNKITSLPYKSKPNLGIVWFFSPYRIKDGKPRLASSNMSMFSLTWFETSWGVNPKNGAYKF